jgi:hypothetical protein
MMAPRSRQVREQEPQGEAGRYRPDVVHYDNGSAFCEAQLAGRGRVTAVEDAVTCPSCLDRFGWMARLLSLGGEPPRPPSQIDWFGEGG